MPSDHAAIRRLDDEHDNFWASLSWFVEGQDVDHALRLIAALADYWVVRGRLSEARSHVEAALAIDPEQSPALRVKVLAIASDVARGQGDVDRARAFCEESLVLARRLGDPRGVGRALHELGEAAMAQEDLEGAADFFEEAIAVGRSAGFNAAGSVGNLGYVALLQGDYVRALTLSREAMRLFQERGHTSGVAVALSNLADATLLLGDMEEARVRIRESLELARALGFKEVIASGLEASAALLADRHRLDLAARLIGASDAVRKDIDLSQTPAERRIRDTVDATVRASLGNDVVETLQDEGRKLGIDDAIALAMTSID
jgi:tetratricopeptide (TPR) repeat protein